MAKYSTELKMKVVKAYLNNEGGYEFLAFTRKSRKYYSYKRTVGKVAPNRIKRRFNTCVVHRKITTDTSGFKYYEKDKSGNLKVKSFI